MTTDTIARRKEGRGLTGFDIANWLCLAAAPTFALMALLSGALGGGHPDSLCASAQEASPLGGMASMYLLMSAFHSMPWLRLVTGRRRAARGSL